MEYFVNLFGSLSNLTGVLQIGLDIFILGLLAVLLAGRKRKVTARDGEVIESFEKIIEETGTISREFGINLEKRQELIRDITARLDQRIQEARDLCARLDHMARTGVENLDSGSSNSSAAHPPDSSKSGKTDRQKVLFLAGKGLDAAAIAKSLKKPVGEVELILNLCKIAS